MQQSPPRSPGDRSAGDRSLGEVCGGRFSLVSEIQRERHHSTTLYRGLSTSTEVPVAVKLERPKPGGLQEEVGILEQLARPTPPQGFLSVRFWGLEGVRNCLVTELLGQSLAHCMREHGKLSAQDTLLIAQQALQRVEYLHSNGIVHRDITPRNFVYGLDRKAHHLYLTEFGSSKPYWDGSARRHRMQRTSGLPVGALPYMSVNAHHGLEQSRRDDLEAVGYMLVDCMRPLPWADVQAQDDAEAARQTRHQKEAVDVEELCRGLPEPLRLVLTEARELEFNAKPNYPHVNNAISELVAQHGLKEHQLSWLSGVDVSSLEPLEKPERPLQPDEIVCKKSTSWLTHMASGRPRGRCFLPCGRSTRVAE